MRKTFISLLLLALMPVTAAASEDLFDKVEHHTADNSGVKIHYVSIGEGPTVLFVHGFPNWWYDWRNQMEALRDGYRCVAMDTRGYNRSDQPQEVEAYAIENLLGDVEAVIRDLGVETVTLVGHDWGGAIAWRFAIQHPDRVNKLVILNLTHPRGYLNVRLHGSDQQKARMEYIRNFQKPDAHLRFTPEMFAARYRKDPVVHERYLEAYRNSSFNSMLNYYRAIWPQLESGDLSDVENLQMPVLQFHGLRDFAVDKDGLRDTWNWVDRDYTLVTIPTAGHDPHHEAPEQVNAALRSWLDNRPLETAETE